MKRIDLLIISFFIFFCVNTKAQKYFPLPDSGAVWTSAKIDTNGIYVQNIKFLISSDTVIQGKIYKKVYYSSDSIINFPKMNYFGCLREDSNHRWFSIMKNEKTVMSLYDFSLKVGDSVETYIYQPGPGYGSRLKVLSIDSILIGTEYRKRINLKTLFLYKDFYPSWVEGIGSLNQLFLPYVLLWTYDYKLMCFEEDGVLKYHNSPNSNCYYVGINENLKSNYKNLISYPNPVKAGQIINIDNIKAGIYHLTIIDLYGRNKSETNITSTGQIRLNADLKSGIYIIKLNGTDNSNGYFKLIVE